MARFGDPSLGQITCGQLVDLVVRVGAGTEALALWHQEACVLTGRPMPAEANEVWTLYGAVVGELLQGKFQLEIVDATQCFRKPDRDFAAFHHMKELCAGIGGFLWGFEPPEGPPRNSWTRPALHVRRCRGIMAQSLQVIWLPGMFGFVCMK